VRDGARSASTVGSSVAIFVPSRALVRTRASSSASVCVIVVPGNGRSTMSPMHASDAANDADHARRDDACGTIEAIERRARTRSHLRKVAQFCANRTKNVVFATFAEKNFSSSSEPLSECFSARLGALDRRNGECAMRASVQVCKR